MRAAIIGAGAAGLVTAREFVKAGIDAVIFEQGKQCGGLWVFESKVEADPLGDRTVHGSLYESLCTNLPSDLMAFMDYPFDSRGGGKNHWPRFPPHTAVLEYLQNFARDHELLPLIRFESKVESVLQEAGRWKVSVNGDQTETFDYIAVCNGHFSKPRLTPIEGEGTFRGVRIHSHNYREPSPYRQQRVLVLGTGASGSDIALEVAREAAQVYWSGFQENESSGLIQRKPWPIKISANHVMFEDGSEIEVDALLYCTGYDYHMPFLEPDLINIGDNHVYPLYRDILLPGRFGIGIIGLPFLVVPFPLYALQAKWFVHSLGRAQPSPTEMLAEIDAHVAEMAHQGVKPRHYHRLGDQQQSYYNRLAAECGAEPLPEGFVELGRNAQQLRAKDPAGFRDAPLLPARVLPK